MLEAAVQLLFFALVGAVAVAVMLGPRLWRLRKLQRENDELRRKYDQLRRENSEGAHRVLEQWTPRAGPS